MFLQCSLFGICLINSPFIAPKIRLLTGRVKSVKNPSKKYPMFMSDDAWVEREGVWLCSNCDAPRENVAPDFGRSWISTSFGIRGLSGAERNLQGLEDLFDTCPCRRSLRPS